MAKLHSKRHRSKRHHSKRHHSRRLGRAPPPLMRKHFSYRHATPVNVMHTRRIRSLPVYDKFRNRKARKLLSQNFSPYDYL